MSTQGDRPERHDGVSGVYPTSRYEILPQGFGHRVGSIARTKFDLRLFQVATYGLVSEPKLLGHVVALAPRGHETQNGKFTRCQAAPRSNPVRIRTSQLL
jgi:hypothetical protein